MPPDQNQQHPRRPHYHRGRRGPDRRGDRRPPPQQQQSDSGNRDQLDVEQIMREIRSRISEKHGIELTTQQIQELAARRLEAILDPRAIKPSLMDELRRASGLPADTAPSEPEGDDSIDEAALYASKSGFLNSLRRLFNLLNPKAIVDALNALSRRTKAIAARETELRRRQTEWNALHFEILRRLVTDIARTEIDNQHLAHRVESLQARVDFNERRVRSLEHSQPQQQQQHQHQPRPASRPLDTPAVVSAPPASARGDEAPSTEHAAPSPDGSPEGSRRRRRRRRGRRSGAPRDITGTPAPGLAAPGVLDQQDQGGEGDDFTDEDAGPDDLADDVTVAPSETPERVESAFEPPPSPPEEPVHVAHSDVDDAPAPPEVASTSEPVVTSEPSDPFAREQS
jgi:hypothetical protein